MARKPKLKTKSWLYDKWFDDPADCHKEAVELGAPIVSFFEWQRLYPDLLYKHELAPIYVRQLKRDCRAFLSYKGRPFWDRRRGLRLVRSEEPA